MSVQVGRWPCLHAGDSSPEGCCCRFCPLASCSPSPQCQAPTSQVKNQEEIVAGEGLRLSPQPRLPALTHCMDGKREGGEAPKQDMQEYQHNLGKDTCTHTDCTRTGMR